MGPLSARTRAGSIMVAISMAILWSGDWLTIVDPPAFNTQFVTVAGIAVIYVVFRAVARPRRDQR